MADPGAGRTLVAGVDSSTQSCKVVVHDAGSGEVVRSGAAPHPGGTEVDPEHWWTALQQAITAAGGIDDVAAVAVGGQQHGMVCLDDGGDVVRDALLWNDTRSATAALDLIAELDGGAQAWADAIGSVPVASFTGSKPRWLATHEPENAARTVAVCLPHDWLTWRLGGAGGLDRLVTDRSDASGTMYWSPATGAYRPDLLQLAFGATPALPTVLGPHDPVPGTTAGGMLLGPGAGDNAAAALGVGAGPADVVVSVGTSGVVSAVASTPTADADGIVAGFADATGRFLPLACTNGARVLTSTARVLGVDVNALSDLALGGPVGAGGLAFVPYLEGERTPNRPDATGALHGLDLDNTTPVHLARAAFEGLLCVLADGLDALVAQGVEVRRVLLVGGGAQSPALRRIAPAIFGVPVTVPEPAEYVARGAARQAAWVLAGGPDAPDWTRSSDTTYRAEPTPDVRARYAEVREMTARRLGR